jgi:hypothetical protein
MAARVSAEWRPNGSRDGSRCGSEVAAEVTVDVEETVGVEVERQRSGCRDDS